MKLSEDPFISTDNFVSYLEHLYENMNVYQCLIVYDNNDIQGSVIADLSTKLRQHDYPLCELHESIISEIELIETKYRVFLIPYDLLDVYIHQKHNDLGTVNVILCIGNYVYEQTRKQLQDPINSLADRLYIFSCNKVLT